LYCSVSKALRLGDFRFANQIDAFLLEQIRIGVVHFASRLQIFEKELLVVLQQSLHGFEIDVAGSTKLPQ